jgi:hypothetical protein
MFLMTFFRENYDFVRETKIVPCEKNTLKVKEAPRKLTVLQIWGNHVDKRRYTPNLGPFTGNPGVKQILTQQNCDK